MFCQTSKTKDGVRNCEQAAEMRHWEESKMSNESLPNSLSLQENSGLLGKESGVPKL
jgi:hypothetical protein